MRQTRILFFSLLFFSLASCSDKAPPAPPKIEVVVTPAELVPFKNQKPFVGRLEAAEDIAIQAKVSGYLKSRTFKEGESVKKGQILFTLDQASFKAAVEQAEADVQRTQANEVVAKSNFDRGLQLKNTGAISAAEMDKLEGQFLESKAALSAAKANLESAQVNLDFTVIKAPIDGTIGRSSVSVGDLIGPESGPLTTLVSIGTMKAVFSVNERLLLQSRAKRIREGENVVPVEMDVQVELSDGEIYPHSGHIDYVSNRVDQATGTLEVWAIIPNPDKLLSPGQYARVLVTQPEAIPTLMVPQATVQSDQKGDYVMVVDSANKVQRKDVKLGNRIQERVVVLSGVKEGDRVILRGLQKVKAGQEVLVKVLEPELAAPKPKVVPEGGAGESVSENSAQE